MFAILVAATHLAGWVESAHARQAGDVIVTESRVRLDDGSVADVIQLGGAVDGIGMWFSDLPGPLAAGDRVDGVAVATGGRSLQLVAAAAAGAPAAAVDRLARYGVVHTTGGHPVWHASACRYLAYGASITPDAGRAIDAARDAWSDAGRTCGGSALHRLAGKPATAAIDGVDSIHLLTERWCRLATATEPTLCYNPSATGVTRLKFIDDPYDPDDGRIVEGDVELNGVGFAFEPGTRPVIDLASLATHELGHLLGLTHSCATGTEPWPSDHSGARVPACDGLAPGAPAASATMFYRLAPGETWQRTLEEPDRAAACALAHGAVCESDATGGVGCRAAAPGLPTALVTAAVMRRRRRRARA
jgi:hypothetical protein